MHSKILRLAVPSIISNLTVPLLGLLDVVVVGHLENTSYIGAIAVGAMMFSLLYWGFGFLRMGTGGLTAQAFGSGKQQEIAIQLIRPLLIAWGVSVVILCLHVPLEWLIFTLIGEEDAGICHWASVYFRICVWGAPAVLSLYAFNGWFIGLQRPQITMVVALAQNLINIGLSLFFVFVCGMQVEGVAWGTLLAQWAGFLLSVLFWRLKFRAYPLVVGWKTLIKKEEMKRYFQVNRDIFLRTLCLIAVNTAFTTLGARQGEIILAVNTLMMQLFTIFSYMMDGFAYAGEALVGCYYGAHNRIALNRTVRALFHIGWGISVLFALIYGVGGNRFLALLTNQQQILEAATVYSSWALLIPLCGFAAFLWDGIFIGLTATGPMFRVMLCAMLLFFVFYFLLAPSWGNHGLWIAFLIYLTVRGVGQWYFYEIKLRLKRFV